MDSGVPAFLRPAEIGGREILASVLRRWRFIAATTILGGIIAVVVTLILGAIQPRYHATADLIIVGSKYQLNLDPRFQTVDPLRTDSQPAPISTRASEFRAIAQSPEVKRLAAQGLTERADLSDSEIGSTVGEVDVKIQGTAISIIATAPDAATAAQRANAYAAAAQQRLNEIYGATEEEYGRLQEANQEAKARFAAAEKDVTEFVRSNQIDELSAALNLKLSYLDRLKEAKAVGTVSTADRVKSYYANLGALTDLERDARTLRQQIQTGDESPSAVTANSLALIDLQTRFIVLGNLASETPSGTTVTFDEEGKPIVQTVAPESPRGAVQQGLQIQISPDAFMTPDGSRQSTLRDVDALLSGIDSRRTTIQNELDTLSRSIAQGEVSPIGDNSLEPDLDQAIATLEQETAQLRGELREEQFRESNLNRTLEAAQTQLTTVATKLDEANITRSTVSGSFARIGSSAEVPARPSFPSPLPVSLALGLIVALLFSVLAVVVWAWWQLKGFDLSLPEEKRSAAPSAAAAPLAPARQ